MTEEVKVTEETMTEDAVKDQAQETADVQTAESEKTAQDTPAESMEDYAKELEASYEVMGDGEYRSILKIKKSSH